jgi:hypothetical protein
VRSVVSFLFIVFLIWNYIGFFTYFQIEKHAIKKAVKLKLNRSVPENQLHTFQFTENQISQLNWYEEHEFRYKDKMYDIVYSTSLDNGAFIFQCVSDEQETKLFAQLNKLIQNEVNDEKNIPLGNWKAAMYHPQFIQGFSSFYISEDFPKSAENNWNHFFSIQLGHLDQISKPPDFIYS